MAAWILNQQHPSVVERINLDCLSLLAKNSHPERLACTVSPDFEAGSFNVVWFLEFTSGSQESLVCHGPQCLSVECDPTC